jgi:transcriptional regulator with XRE-family HTH domain
MVNKHDKIIVANGNWGTVECAVLSGNKSPASEFLNALKRDTNYEKDWEKIRSLLFRMACNGKIFDDRKFKHEDGPIWAFKSFQIRLPCFQFQRRWIITHGFFKKEDKWQSRQLDRAKRIMNEFLTIENKGLHMAKTLIEQWVTSDEDKRLFAQENLILECTERVCELMNQKNVSRSELANRLGKTKGYVSQLLNGSRNLTVRTLADMFFALDSEAKLQISPLRSDRLGPEEPQYFELNTAGSHYTIHRTISSEQKVVHDWPNYVQDFGNSWKKVI